MNKQEILEKLSNHIEQMIVQFETICSHSDRIPTIEMDRMLSEIRATYELFTVLNYVNTYGGEAKNPLLEKIQQTKQMMASMATKVETPMQEEHTTAPAIKEENTTPTNNPISFETAIPAEQEKPKIEETPIETTEVPVIQNEANSSIENTAKEEKEEEEKLHENTLPIETKNEQEVIAATVSNTETPVIKKINTDSAPKGLHNKSLEEEDGYIADKIGVKVADLRKNVALHEKFLYINELFGGNNNTYNEMIEAIEAGNSIEEASKIVQYYGEKFNWNPESKTFKQLRLLIQRRF